jgi:hypothetical protein
MLGQWLDEVAADHGRFGSGSDEAEPRKATLQDPRHHEQHRRTDQQPGCPPLHAVELDLLVRVLLVNRNARRRRGRYARARREKPGRRALGFGWRAKLGYRHEVKAERTGEPVEGRSGPTRPLRGACTPFRMQAMEKRDYLLRQIEALGRILSRLRELIVGGATAAASSEIREEMRNAGLDLSMANALDAKTLLMLLGSPVLDVRRAFTVASLLHMDALRARAEGDEVWAARSSAAAVAVLSAARPMLDAVRAALVDQILEEIRGAKVS